MTEREGGLSLCHQVGAINRIIAVSCGGHHLGLSPRGPGLVLRGYMVSRLGMLRILLGTERRFKIQFRTCIQMKSDTTTLDTVEIVWICVR